MHGLRLLCIASLMLGVSACQSLMPKASGLVQPNWSQVAVETYQRQDQVDVKWREQSFSFLLYQQQHGQVLELIALSLTGQQLFEVTYNGQQIQVKQRIEQMRLLPFEFVVRDILLATYPNFKQSPAMMRQHDATGEQVYIQKQHVLNIHQQGKMIELNNVQVPYQMTFSPIENTLQSN